MKEFGLCLSMSLKSSSMHSHKMGMRWIYRKLIRKASAKGRVSLCLSCLARGPFQHQCTEYFLAMKIPLGSGLRFSHPIGSCELFGIQFIQCKVELNLQLRTNLNSETQPTVSDSVPQSWLCWRRRKTNESTTGQQADQSKSWTSRPHPFPHRPQKSDRFLSAT